MSLYSLSLFLELARTMKLFMNVEEKRREGKVAVYILITRSNEWNMDPTSRFFDW